MLTDGSKDLNHCGEALALLFYDDVLAARRAALIPKDSGQSEPRNFVASRLGLGQRGVPESVNPGDIKRETSAF
jgi:hypothetical protein